MQWNLKINGLRKKWDGNKSNVLCFRSYAASIMQLFLPELEYQPLNRIAPCRVMPLECPEKPGLQNRAWREEKKTKYL